MSQLHIQFLPLAFSWPMAAAAATILLLRTWALAAVDIIPRQAVAMAQRDKGRTVEGATTGMVPRRPVAAAVERQAMAWREQTPRVEMAAPVCKVTSRERYLGMPVVVAAGVALAGPVRPAVLRLSAATAQTVPV